MRIGIPKELRSPWGSEERRVGLSPPAVRELTAAEHELFVESEGGKGAGFADEEYRKAGASVLYARDEVYKRSDLVVKVGPLVKQDWQVLRDQQTIMGFLYLEIATKELLSVLIQKKITTIGYEGIQRPDGVYPILRPMSRIAGKLAVQIAGRLLESSEFGGRGILLGGLPGIPPAEIAILGAGILGTCAAQSFCGVGANVYVLDKDPVRLEEVEKLASGKIVTILYNRQNLRKVCRFADVLVSCVRVPHARTPRFVTREMVKEMKKGAVILEFSIPEGGCVETARLTPREDYVYVEEDVLHFCVPNVPTFVARTATYALTNALLPYLLLMAEKGVKGALKECADLRKGVQTLDGNLTSEPARGGELPYAEVDMLLQKE